jgi:hypothetical protein
VKVFSEDSSLFSVYILVCNIYSDVSCMCGSCLKKVELRFIFTHNGVNTFLSYVHSETHVVIDVILAIILNMYSDVVTV